MNWYYGVMKDGHATEHLQFGSEGAAMWHFLSYVEIQAVYDCGPHNEDNALIWSECG
jgi:hypothetical protein